jgi:hypothetical protein
MRDSIETGAAALDFLHLDATFCITTEQQAKDNEIKWPGCDKE